MKMKIFYSMALYYTLYILITFIYNAEKHVERNKKNTMTQTMHICIIQGGSPNTTTLYIYTNINRVSQSIVI